MGFWWGSGGGCPAKSASKTDNVGAYRADMIQGEEESEKEELPIASVNTSSKAV